MGGINTWGKLKFKKTPQTINNFELNNIWIMFDLEDDEKYPLHVSKLEKNEVYFDILCDYHKYENVNPYDYSQNDDFFSLNIPKKQKNNIPIYYIDLFKRLENLQKVLEKLFGFNDVIELTFFNTDMGTPCFLEDYKLKIFDLENFAYEFFKLMNEMSMFTPTIKVVFSKNNSS